MKRIALALAGLLALPHVVCYLIARGIMGQQRAILSASERLGKWPGRMGLYVRLRFYQQVLDQVGGDVHIGYMTLLSKTQARLADRVYIGRLCTVGWVDIGQDAKIADGVQILSGRHQHQLNNDSHSGNHRDDDTNTTCVRIGASAWIGAGAVVMADVGEQAVVAAGAVVVDPVPAGGRVGGVPARPLNSRVAEHARIAFNSELKHETH